MGGIRVRWRTVGKVAAIAVGGVLALQALPGLLKAPEPPPLAADVGLPRVEAPLAVRSGTAGASRPHTGQQAPHPSREAAAPAAALPAGVISSVPHRHTAPRPRPEPVPPAAPAVAPAPPPPPAEPSPPAPSSPPAAPPPPPPPPPNDGSLEFAPH